MDQTMEYSLEYLDMNKHSIKGIILSYIRYLETTYKADYNKRFEGFIPIDSKTLSNQFSGTFTGKTNEKIKITTQLIAEKYKSIIMLIYS